MDKPTAKSKAAATVKLKSSAKEPLTMLLDADIVLFQMATVNEYDLRWNNGIHTLHSDEAKCKASVINRIEHLKQLTGATSVICCITDSSNFRKQVYADYKMQRKATRKPLVLDTLRAWLPSEYPTVMWDTLEGDDCMGILSTTEATSIDTSFGKTKLATKRVIVSEDKDLEQIPGYIFNPSKDSSIRKVHLSQANYRFFMQVLTGDATDGYPGLPGLGPVGAEKVLLGRDLLDELKCWEAIVAAYVKKGLTEEDALVQARMARILRAEDYSAYKGVKLWEPKNAGL